MSAHGFRSQVTPGGAVSAALELVDGQLVGTCGDEDVQHAVRRIDGSTVVIKTAEGWCRAYVFHKSDVTYVAIGGEVFEIRDADAAGEAAVAEADQPFATSPMTGIVAKVSVAPGDAVKAGAELFIVEAMKMEYVVRAPRDLVVGPVSAEVGASVDLGDVLVTYADDA